jgi:hypothetical protein
MPPVVEQVQSERESVVSAVHIDVRETVALVAPQVSELQPSLSAIEVSAIATSVCDVSGGESLPSCDCIASTSSDVEATDLSISVDEGATFSTATDTPTDESDLQSYVARYNKPLQVLTAINNNIVECLPCSRAQRHRNPFRIDRKSRRPGAFFHAIHQHCSSTAADGGPGTHAKNVEKFCAYLKSQTQISFIPARAREPEQDMVVVKCRGYMPQRLTTTVKLPGTDTDRRVDLDPRIFLDDLSMSRTASTGAIIWYGDPAADAYRHRYDVS